MTTISLPVPPSVNGLYRNVQGRGRVKTKRYMEWINAAGWALLESRPRKHNGAVSVHVLIEEPKRARDIDNILKPLLDLLTTHRVISDDSSKVVREITIGISPDVVGCHVTIKPEVL